jgi:hypothetical protein
MKLCILPLSIKMTMSLPLQLPLIQIVLYIYIYIYIYIDIYIDINVLKDRSYSLKDILIKIAMCHFYFICT